MIDKKRDTCIDDYDDVVINNQLSILDRAVIILVEWTFAFILIVSRAPVVLFEKPRNGRPHHSYHRVTEFSMCCWYSIFECTCTSTVASKVPT